MIATEIHINFITLLFEMDTVFCINFQNILRMIQHSDLIKFFQDSDIPGIQVSNPKYHFTALNGTMQAELYAIAAPITQQ